MLPRPFKALNGFLWIREIETPKGRMRVMQQGGVYQSASYLGKRRFDPPFAYLSAFDHVFELDLCVLDVLMLGGGGYSWPKHVLVSRDDVRLDVVELDPACTKAARRYLYLDDALALAGEDGLSVVHGDGLDFLRTCGKHYQAIVNDAFFGERPVSGLMSDEGLRLVKNHLSVGGAYFVNLVANEGSVDVEQACAAMRSVFDFVYLVDARDFELSEVDNFLLIGALSHQEFGDLIQGWERLA